MVACHPALTFGFFLCAIVLSVVVQHPLWLGVCIVCSAALYLCVRGRAAGKMIALMAVVFCLLAAVNPLFNTMGNTVLFTYLHDRPYTLEALLFGMQTAGLFVSIMLWFASFNRVVSSDQLTSLFGGLAPSITLVLTMILRLIPAYTRKAKQISEARACVGLSVSAGSLRDRGRDGMATLSALTTWAFESSVTTADSMRSRGYGARKDVPQERGWQAYNAQECNTQEHGAQDHDAQEYDVQDRSLAIKRTQYAYHPFKTADKVRATAMAVLFGVAVFAIFSGCASAEYLPSIAFPPMTPLSVCGFIAFTLFLSIPSLICVQKRLSWRNSISKM